MSYVQEFTSEEVVAHNKKKDLWVVINGSVYDITPFVDEHPGGEEVLLDVAGQDATEAFDDVGHSDEAREILQGLLKGKLKGGVIKPEVDGGDNDTGIKPSPDSSISLYIAIVAGLLMALGAYKYLQLTGNAGVAPAS